MKTKPILIIIACLAVVVCVFFVVKAKYFNKPEKGNTSGVVDFLNEFNEKLKTGNPDSVRNYFDIKDAKALTTFIYLLNGTNTVMDIKVNLNTQNSKISFINPTLIQADIPVALSRDSMENKLSSITFTIQKRGNSFYITNIKPDVFMANYMAYINLARRKILSEKDIFSAITLASFKIADQLKSRYDSVLWFSHINDKTYYYVVKGKWNMDAYLLTKDTARTYQMGLLSPELKEIIPPQYDLVHNINGTFPGLIEVEKDHKHGFYDLDGKVVLPVEFDQVFPVKGGENLAALRKGDDYYWLKNDLSVSDKVDLKIGDIISNLKQPDSYTLTNDTTDNITEFNSREIHSSLHIPPSYLVDLNILPAIKCFKNPLRKNVYFDDASSLYTVKLDKAPTDDSNWLTAMFYSIRDYFLGGRAEFYDTKNMVVLDKKKNKVYSYTLNTDMSEEEDGGVTTSCNEYTVKPLSDSLFEVKASTVLGLTLYNDNILSEAPYYHYLNLKNGKLVEMNTGRLFSFTKFIRMDDSYLNGCYLYSIKTSKDKYEFKDKQTDHLDNDALQYMKNEIFADYNYEFKDTVWTNLFKERMQNYKPANENINDSLTTIDKYNISWINQKLNASKAKKLAAN